MKVKLSLLLLTFLTLSAVSQTTTIAINGNSYITSKDINGVKIGKQGLRDWSSPTAEVSTYFKLSNPGTLELAIEAANAGEPSKIRVTVGAKSSKKVFDIELKNSNIETIPVGVISIADTGYLKVTVQGVEKNGSTFGTIKAYEIKGSATDKGVVHCGSFEPYWANRGPSVHMKYALPKDSNTEYFYNEVTVRKGNDPIGSYFMGCGFGEGYFGMQVNSPTERRILFSVWSPFDTQDPKEIPDSLKIKLLQQGEGVTIGEFGNEGSGGQSYMKYNWITGNTYKFLMQVHPDGNDNTIYTAYFYAPEKGKWQVIASFLRPKTNTYYTNAHSFLENFIPNQGYITRQVEFGNQWARSADGVWSEVTEGLFTFDATAKAGARKDYGAGVTNNNFYLKNCGFFNQSTPYKAVFTRKAAGKKPMTDIQGATQE